MSNPFQHEKRRRFTPLERAEFFAKANGHCQKCTRKIMYGEDWDLDHELALSLGGTNDDANIRVLCSYCHDPKSADDTTTAAKSKRVYVQNVVPGRFKKSKSWGSKRW